MALDDKNIRKKKDLQSDRGSEKNRIKNITSKVHPEYAASSNRKRSSRELSEEEKEKRAQIAEVRRKTAASGTPPEDHTAQEATESIEDHCFLFNCSGTGCHCFYG